ncbi:MAG: hypothetical protein ACJ79K_06840 [Gemmatimonadaceae bacterium]
MIRGGKWWVAAAAVALLLTRSYWLPPTAPTWLRGASPFTWQQTRSERAHCLAFANMMGSVHPEMTYIDEDRKAKPVVAIERTLRAGDSLVFEGDVRRGKYIGYVFHCATANVRGNPGDHRSAIAEPWSGADDWAQVHDVEMRLQRSCFDSAARFYPTSRFSDRTLIVRRPGGTGVLYAAAQDTVYETEPQQVTCSVAVGGNGRLFVNAVDPNSKM